MGEQPLYDVKVELLDATTRCSTRRPPHRPAHAASWTGTKDQWGESFQFVVNGVPFFAKGANWIPADALPVAHDAASDYRQRCCAAPPTPT